MIVLQHILRNEYLKQAHKLSLQKQNNNNKNYPKTKSPDDSQLCLLCRAESDLWDPRAFY